MDQTAHRSKWLAWTKYIVIGSIVCLAVAVFMTTQWYFTPSSKDNLEQWPTVFSHYLLASCAWGLLTIAIQPIVSWLGFNRRHWIRTIIIYFLLGIAFSFLNFVTINVLVRILEFTTSGTIHPVDVSLDRVIAMFKANMVVFLVIASFCLTASYLRKFQERELRASKLETQLTAAHLGTLKSQLQPHFLFNTLNSIAALIQENPAAAEQMVVWLSDLLRSTLDNVKREEAKLSEELEFSQRYLEIEKMRFGDRLVVETQISSEVEEALVPILILQPLVENAVRHGVASTAENCIVKINAHRTDRVLQIAISNKGISSRKPPKNRSGVGLKNTTERLKLLYGEQFQLDTDEDPEGTFNVHIEIPYRSSRQDLAIQ